MVSGHQLVDADSLYQSNVSKESTVNLLLVLRGGMQAFSASLLNPAVPNPDAQSSPPTFGFEWEFGACGS